MTLPNQLSLLRIILSPVFLFLFLSENPFYKKISLFVFFFATLTDYYDGWHARKFGSVSKTGIFLDPLADKVLTSAAFIGFYYLGIMPLWMVIIIVVRDLVITVLRSYQEFKGKTLATSYSAKVKTFIQMTYVFLLITMICLLSFDVSENLKGSIVWFLGSWINYALMLIVTAITLYTGVIYFFGNNTLAQTVENN